LKMVVVSKGSLAYFNLKARRDPEVRFIV
jgi:hypothetical protein